MLGKGYDHRRTTFRLRKTDKVAQKIVVTLMNTVKEANGCYHFKGKWEMWKFISQLGKTKLLLVETISELISMK